MEHSQEPENARHVGQYYLSFEKNKKYANHLLVLFVIKECSHRKQNGDSFLRINSPVWPSSYVYQASPWSKLLCIANA